MTLPQPTAPTPPKVFQGPPPKPVGSILQAAELSPIEQQLLKDMGWDGTSSVPSDIAERLDSDPLARARSQQQLQQALHAATQALPEDFQMPTQDLQVRDEEETLTPSQLDAAMARYNEVVSQATAATQAPAATDRPAASRPAANPNAAFFEAQRRQGVADIQQSQLDAGLNPQIAQAVAEIEEEIRQPATEIRNSAEAPAAEKTTEQPAEKTPEQLRQEHRETLLRLIPEEARVAYRDAVVTFQAYTKTYELFNGRLQVTFRDIGLEEQAMIVRQEAIDRRRRRVLADDLPNLIYASKRYLFAAMLQRVVNVETQVAPVDLPSGRSTCDFLSSLDREQLQHLRFEADDTDMYVWYRFLVTTALSTSLYHLLFEKFEEFNRELTGLQVLARDRDFF